MRNMKTIEYENLAKLNQPFFDEYRKSFEQTLQSGWYILGKNLEKFEAEFAAYHNAKHCIGVASGLDALILSLRALQLPKNSEVIVPSNTYIASILAILQANLVPVLVEPDERTCNLDSSKIEETITKNTRAILPVHLYGKVCQMDKILQIAKKYDLRIVEDCAQAHGATFKGQKAGTFGDFGAFSFYPTKNFGSLGDAGGILTNDDELADYVRMLRNYGSKVKYKNEIVGYNSRLDEIQAGFLSVKLQYLDEINSHKRKLARIYFDILKDDFVKPDVNEDFLDVYHIFNIRHKRRDELKKYLESKGILTGIHYPIAPADQKALKGVVKGNFPIASKIHEQTLSLPLSYFHTEEDVECVAKTINKFINN